MKLRNNIFVGAAFILFGFLMLLSYRGYIDLGLDDIIGISLIFYGVPTVYQSLNHGVRSGLFFSSILFLIGIIFLVKSNFEIINSRGLVLSSTLFIFGTSLFMLYIENTKEKILLYAAVILMLMGYASTTISKTWGIISFVDKIADAAETYGSIIIIFFGLNLFLNRKR